MYLDLRLLGGGGGGELKNTLYICYAIFLCYMGCEIDDYHINPNDNDKE